MKKCPSCGAQLPDGARACPRCGTFVPDPGAEPDALNLPTVSSSPSAMVDPTAFAAPYTPSQQPPSGYGAYGTPPPPSYDPYLVQSGAPPYGAKAEYAPPPPVPQSARSFPSQPVYSPFVSGMQQPQLSPRRSQGKRIALIAGIVILALILVGEGVFLLAPGHPSPGPITQGTPNTAATSTNQSDQDPYGTFGGTLVTSDPMHDNSKGNKWDEATMNDQLGIGKATCGFTNGAYHLTRTTKGWLTCDPEAANLTLSNVVFEATITLLQGDEAGIQVRLDQTKETSYITSLSPDGHYVIDTVNSIPNPQNPYTILRSGNNDAIKTGLNQPNVVALAANADTISLYINGQFIDSTTNMAFKSGQIGVYGYTSTNNMDVMVSNVRVWKL